MASDHVVATLTSSPRTVGVAESPATIVIVLVKSPVPVIAPLILISWTSYVSDDTANVVE